MNDLETISRDFSRLATELLEILSPEQRRQITLSFDDEEERRRWFYTPTPRPGLPLQAMNPIQKQFVHRLLAVGLSEAGYNYASAIMGLELVVDYHQGFPNRTYGDLPGTRVRDPGNYCVAIFGDPAGEAWTWRIGGHHLSLQFTIRDGKVSATPSFFGAEPAHTKMPGGVLLRVLAAEEDFARALLHMLRRDQREAAVISPIAPTDIVQTNRPRIIDGALPQIGGAGPGGQGLRDHLGLTPAHDEMVRYSLEPKGLKAADMDAAQQEALARLVGVYCEHLAEPIAAELGRLNDGAAFASTAFAWAGPGEFGAPHYYRVQGERLLIEYDCTQNDANHTHSVIRDAAGDFGDDILARHYAMDHGS